MSFMLTLAIPGHLHVATIPQTAAFKPDLVVAKCNVESPRIAIFLDGYFLATKDVVWRQYTPGCAHDAKRG